MKKFSRFITKNYIAVIVVSLVLFFFGLYGMTLTKINYDILSYLPDDLRSVQGQHILDNSFKTSGTALLLTDVTDMKRVERLKNEIGKVDGVEKVTWIDNVTDINIPLNYISDKDKEQFIKGNLTIMNIQFKKSASNDLTFKAVDNIKKLLDEKSYFGGMAAVINDLRHLMDTEKILYLVVAVVLILILLSITLDSFAISFLFLLSIGIAVVYNLGTNFFRGNISYITSSIAAVLQLGVTMDFSIFLYHRYEHERKTAKDKLEAMSKAMSSTSVAIITSALATASGFLALIPMKIKIGEDMGIVLAKGVILGVITALTFLPAILLLFDNLIEKTKHKALLPSFERSSEFITKNYRLIFIVFIILFIPAYFGKTHAQIYYNITDALPQDIPSMKSTNVIKDKFNITEVIYVITNKSSTRESEETFSQQLKSIPNVKDSSSMSSFADSSIPESFLPDRLKDQFQKDNYRYISVNLTTKAAADETNKTIDLIQDAANKNFGSDCYLCGEAVLTKDMIKLVDKDIKMVDVISIGAVFIILLLAFKSVSLPLLLVLVIELAIFFNLGIPYYTGTSIPFIASMTVGAIQLGSTVNYSILLLSRYKEELRYYEKVTAMKNAIIGSAPSIITSALTLAVATIGVGVVSQVKMIGQFAIMIGRGTLISFVLILFTLPATLLINDAIIKFTTFGWNDKKQDDQAEANLETI